MCCPPKFIPDPITDGFVQDVRINPCPWPTTLKNTVHLFTLLIFCTRMNDILSLLYDLHVNATSRVCLPFSHNIITPLLLFFFFFSNNGHLFKACPCRSDMTVVSRTGELESVNLLLAPVLGCDWGEARRARSLEASQCGDRRLFHTSDSSAKSLFNNNTPNLKVERNVCEEIPHVQAARLLCLTESLLGLF